MHVHSSTRVTKTTATTIDYVLSDLPSSDVSSCVLASGLSDHEAVFTRFSLSKYKNKQTVRLGRALSTKNFATFRHLCSSTDWTGLTDDINHNFDNFLNKMGTAFERAFPVRTIKSRNVNPWTTKGIRTSAKKMRSLIYIKKFTYNLNFLTYFKRYRKIYVNTIKLAKKVHYEKIVLNSNNISRETWSIVNALRNKSSPSIQISPSPDELNDYFIGVAMNLTSGIVTKTDPLSFLPARNRNTHSFFLSPADDDELAKTIFDIKKNCWLSVKLVYGR